MGVCITMALVFMLMWVDGVQTGRTLGQTRVGVCVSILERPTWWPVAFKDGFKD